MPKQFTSSRSPARACRWQVFVTAVGFLVACGPAAPTMRLACAQQVQSQGSAADVAAIRAAAAAYRAALIKGDTEAIKAAWTADGDIVDGWGGHLLPEDVAALADKASTADTPRPEFLLRETKVRFITADVAIEDGVADVVLPGTKVPIEGWFSALWVRSGGGWKLAGLRESERPIAADADMLEDLDWMVGDWALTGDDNSGRAASPDSVAGSTTTMSVRWDAGRSFLVREARVTDAIRNGDDEKAVEVHQRIGWDPLVRRVRSWSFSSDGSRGEATWFRDGDSWVAVQMVVLADGRQETAVNIFTYDGRNRCLWRTLPDALDADDGLPTRATWVRTPKRGEP